jgi:hypothetical protein
VSDDLTGEVVPFRPPGRDAAPDPQALLAQVLEIQRIAREARLGGRLELLLDCAVAAVRSCTACRELASGQDNDRHGSSPATPSA